MHLPKTIDNDYTGIDFTFGYFTAVDTLATEIRNLLADAEAGRTYFLAETMGRSAGWLAYGAAIAGEASLVISVEDITGKYRDTEEVDRSRRPARRATRTIMNVDEVVKRIVATMRVREESEGKEFGVIVMAEGLAEFLPDELPAGRRARRARPHRDRAGQPGPAVFADWSPKNTRRRPAASARSPACSSATRRAAPSRTPSTSCSAASWASAPIGRWSKSSSTA